jgi:hypothetical protein
MPPHKQRDRRGVDDAEAAQITDGAIPLPLSLASTGPLLLQGETAKMLPFQVAIKSRGAGGTLVWCPDIAVMMPCESDCLNKKAPVLAFHHMSDPSHPPEAIIGAEALLHHAQPMLHATSS